MRRWGIVISLFYAVIVVGLLVPASLLLAGDEGLLSPGFYRDLKGMYASWALWIPIAVFLSGQILLLFLSVDTSHKRLKPRTHILVTCAVTSMLFAVLSLAVVFSLAATGVGGKLLDQFFQSGELVLGFIAIMWAIWGIVFYLYLRSSSPATTRAVSWLLKGSVLELLVAVPCHIIVRRRGECSAPIATSFGICTGIAVMLLSFGPSVLLLYKKRLDAHPKRTPA
jgi:hypothetical protein